MYVDAIGPIGLGSASSISSIFRTNPANDLFNIINPPPSSDFVDTRPWWAQNSELTVFDKLLMFASSTYQQQSEKEEKIFAAPTIQMYIQFPNEQLEQLAEKITQGLNSNDDKATAIIRWVLRNFPYQTDEKNYGTPELWIPPTFSLQKGSGDCVAVYEEVWTNKGLKRVGDLRIGDLLLSYDFAKNRYCYRPIVKIWEKGKLDAVRVKFRNGSWIDVTKDHPFWTRQLQNESTYGKTKLCDIDLSRWWKRKVPCVKALPYEVKDITRLTEDLCFVIGHFLAEGENNNYHVRTSGYAVPTEICPTLDRHNIPYSLMFRKKDKLPYLTFLSSPFKEYLKSMKINSFEMKIPEEIFHLPQNKLQALIDGHILGDGHFTNYKDKRDFRWANNKLFVHSTSSYELAHDLQRIHLQLGTPLYMWLQKDHKGVGNSPIWRLSYNSNSAFSRDFGYDGLSEVSIKEVDFLGPTEMRDFEVLETHTFVNRFGIICHNCEDGAFLVHSLLLHAGIPMDRVRTYGGEVRAGEGAATGGHAWTAYKRELDDEWVILDSSYYPTLKHVKDRPLMKNMGLYVDNYFYFNQLYWTNLDGIDRIHNPGAVYTYSPQGMLQQQLKYAGVLLDAFI